MIAQSRFKAASFKAIRLSLLIGAGVCAFALTSPGQAATVRTFNPATSWSVSRIEPTNGGAPYCTLARRFNGNTVITFARNTSGEGTIAVDFQQPLFDPNQTYRIGLQAGDGLKREFMTKPATPNAVVLRTGQDAQFFGALSQSSELGVILDNRRYAFAVPDFASGTGQLTDCIGTAPSAITPPASAEDNDAMVELRAQLNALKQENAGIVASLKQQSATTAQTTAAMPDTAENKELSARLSQLENEKNALVDKLQSERARQQMEAQDEQALKKALEDQKALKYMLESERVERASLEASLSQKTADAEKRGEMRARIAALETSNAELKTLRETLETERTKRLAVEKLLQEQKAASAASLEDQERLRARVSELETQNKTLKQTAVQVEDMKAQLEDTGERASMEQARREAAEKALQEMQLSASQRAAQLEDLQSKLETERQKMAEAETARQTELTQKHADEVARLNVEMDKLRKQQQMADDLRQKAVAEEARREAAERALQEMQVSAGERAAQLEKLQAQLESERKKMADAESAREAELTQKHAAEITRLNEEMASLRNKTEKATDLQQRVATEQARRVATERELQEMRATLSQKEEALSKLSSERADLLAQVDNVRADAAKVRISADDSAQMKSMADRLAQMESRNSDLMEQLQTVRAKTEAEEKASVTTASNDAATNKKIVEIGRKAEADRRELQALLEAEQVRRKKLEDIMAQGNDNARLKEMNTQIAELSKRNSDLERRLREEESRIAPAAGDDRDVAALRKQLDMLKNDNQMLAEKLAGSSGASVREAQVVYRGDDDMADALAETKSSLASVMAERDEYRDLLQRERMDKNEGGSKDKKDSPGTNARIVQLENERAELVRKLEYERSRTEAIASGKEVPPAAAGESEPELNRRLAAVESEKDRLKKQLDVAQRDVIAARQQLAEGVDDEDVKQLLAENRKLQTELAASGSGANADVRAMQTEIAALRAQNNVLSEEINKRLAAAPTRAAMDNAAAEAKYKVKEAKVNAQAEVADDVQAANRRFEAAEAENIRLARELAKARQNTPVVAPIVSNDQMVASAPVAQQSAKRTPAQMPSNMYTPASIAPAANMPADIGPSGQDIAGFLKRAGIPMVSGFEKVKQVSTPQFGAFRWDTGVVFGTAEQQKVSAQNFEQAINAYLQKTQARCSGTFDRAFDPSQMSTHRDMAVADVACVMPDGTGAGAAMLFYMKDGMFNAVAHEGDIGQFDQAMSTRDQLAKFLKGVL